MLCRLVLRTKICTYVSGTVVCYERGGTVLQHRGAPCIEYCFRWQVLWRGQYYLYDLLDNLALYWRICWLLNPMRHLSRDKHVELMAERSPSSHQDLYIGMRRGSAVRAGLVQSFDMLGCNMFGRSGHIR